MQRIGLLGGTFNPIHIGHLAMAQTAAEKCQLDRVIFVPAHLPPHKHIKRLASAMDRYEMVKRAVAGNALFQVSDFEIRRGGKSYTIETVRHFHRQFPPPAKLFFIVGEDNVEELPTWKDIDAILELVSFIVVSRPGFDGPPREVRYQLVTMPGLDLSSSFLRKNLEQGRSVKYLVPDPVLQYIEQHHLYQPDEES